MYNTIPDYLRKLSVSSLFKTATFRNCWNIWNPEIRRLIGNTFDEDDILNLGDKLANIFRLTGGAGRGQGELSGGGTAWESLICWYVNLCTVGSRVVALKKMSLVPKPIQDATTVNYGNFACNTESDITVIIFPDLSDYNNDIPELIIKDTIGNPVTTYIRGRLNTLIFDNLASRDFPYYQIGVIQCKTNWNDNAQIPMLWDMIYSAGGFRGRNITLGRNNYSLLPSHNFTYSFVTVPSNQNIDYQQDHVAVKRVANLSGGNYWGKPTLPNIAKSVKEIFTNNFNSGARTTLRTDLRSAVPHLNDELSFFRL